MPAALAATGTVLATQSSKPRGSSRIPVNKGGDAQEGISPSLPRSYTECAISKIRCNAQISSFANSDENRRHFDCWKNDTRAEWGFANLNVADKFDYGRVSIPHIENRDFRAERREALLVRVICQFNGMYDDAGPVGRDKLVSRQPELTVCDPSQNNRENCNSDSGKSGDRWVVSDDKSIKAMPIVVDRDDEMVGVLLRGLCLIRALLLCVLCAGAKRT